jgi:hypothetical protein
MSYFLQLVLTLVEVRIQVALLTKEQGLTAESITALLRPRIYNRTSLPSLAADDAFIEVPLGRLTTLTGPFLSRLTDFEGALDGW